MEGGVRAPCRGSDPMIVILRAGEGVKWGITPPASLEQASKP